MKNVKLYSRNEHGAPTKNRRTSCPPVFCWRATLLIRGCHAGGPLLKRSIEHFLYKLGVARELLRELVGLRLRQVAICHGLFERILDSILYARLQHCFA